MLKHLSYSTVNTYRKCAKLYYYTKILGRRVIPPWVFLYGRAVEGGLNYNFAQKIKSRKDVSISKVLEAFDFTWTGETQKEEFDWKGENKAKKKDGGVASLKVYHKERSPLFQPVAVQDKIRFQFDNVDYGWWAYLDMTTEDRRIVDFKATQKSPIIIQAITSDQLTAYALSYRLKYGKPEKSVALEYLINTAEPQTKGLVATRTKEEIDAYLIIVGEVYDSIKKEAFQPCAEGAWWCSIASCGFFRVCKPARTVALIEQLQKEQAIKKAIEKKAKEEAKVKKKAEIEAKKLAKKKAKEKKDAV